MKIPFLLSLPVLVCLSGASIADPVPVAPAKPVAVPPLDSSTDAPLEVLPAENSRPEVKSPPNALQTNWQLTPSGAILPLDDGLPLGQQFSLQLGTPVPQSDWTLDFVISGREGFEFLATPPAKPKAETVPDAGDNEAKRQVRFRIEWRENDLPVHQVRFSYDATKKQLFGWANGTALFDLERIDAIAEGSKLGWGLTSYGNFGPRVVEVSDIHFSPGQPAGAPSLSAVEPLGLAFNGWKAPKTAALSPSVEAVLKSLSAPTESFETRAYALAARLVASANAPLSPDLWGQTQKLVGELKDKPSETDVRAAMLVLPLACARMDKAKRQSELFKVRAFLDRLAPVLWGPGDWGFLARVGLLSPVRAIQASNSGDRQVPAAFVEDWVWQLKKTRPDLGLDATARLIRQDGSGGSAFAWFLPQIREASPALYRAILRVNARSPKEAHLITSGFDNIRDEMASKAAFRLAQIAPDEAAGFFDKIQNPKMRIEVAQFLGEQGGAFSPLVDSEFQKAIEAFRPSRFEATPAPLLVQRARYFERFGKTREAQGFLSEAMARAGEDFNAAESISRFLRDQKDPRDLSWLEKCRVLAIATDKDQDDSGGGGGIYLSATVGVVHELVKRKQIDAALSVAKTLNAQTMPSNRSNALSVVAYALAVSDTPRALKIADELPAADRERVIIGIASKLAHKDFARGWALLDRVSPARKAASVLAFAPLAPPSFAPKMSQLLQSAIDAQLSRPGHLRSGLAERNLEGLEAVTPNTLAALQKSFAKDHTLLARDLFLSVGRSAGLENDELWKRIKATEITSGGTVIVWATGDLNDIKSAIKQNAEAGLDFANVALSGANW